MKPQYTEEKEKTLNSSEEKETDSRNYLPHAPVTLG